MEKKDSGLITPEKFRLTLRDFVSALALVVSITGLYYALNTRISILEERDRQRTQDMTDIKNKVDKIYDIVLKLDKEK